MIRFPFLRYFEIAVQIGFFWFLIGKFLGIDQNLPFLFPESAPQTIVLVHAIMLIMLNAYHVFSDVNPFTKNLRKFMLGIQPLFAALFFIPSLQPIIFLPLLLANVVCLLSLWPEQRYRKSLEAHKHILNRKF
jgi:hypothetical protein